MTQFLEGPCPPPLPPPLIRGWGGGGGFQLCYCKCSIYAFVSNPIILTFSKVMDQHLLGEIMDWAAVGKGGLALVRGGGGSIVWGHHDVTYINFNLWTNKYEVHYKFIRKLKRFDLESYINDFTIYIRILFWWYWRPIRHSKQIDFNCDRQTWTNSKNKIHWTTTSLYERRRTPAM